jgi:hypothetical protein
MPCWYYRAEELSYWTGLGAVVPAIRLPFVRYSRMSGAAKFGRKWYVVLNMVFIVSHAERHIFLTKFLKIREKKKKKS